MAKETGEEGVEGRRKWGAVVPKWNREGPRKMKQYRWDTAGRVMKGRPFWKALPASPGRVRAHLLYTTLILILFIQSLYSITVFVNVPATLSSLRVILAHFLQRQPRVWPCVSSQEMLRELRRLITSRSQETMFEEILMKIMMGHDLFWQETSRQIS